MSVWEHFQGTEVLYKKCKLGASKLGEFFKSPNGSFIKDTLWFIIFYGVLINFVFHLIFRIDLSIINAFASGSTYYVLVDLVKLLAEHKFILFRKK